jgi:RNA polymerase sigma-70 factor, ECF subfamily
VGAAQGTHRQQSTTPKILADILYPANKRGHVSEEEWVALVRKMATGDQLALQSLYQQTHGIVFTLILRITRKPETAEELTVDVFHQIWKRAAFYDPEGGSVVGWIMNQARCRAIDRLRFDQRKKRLNTYPGSLLPITDIVDPEEAAVFEERSHSLQRALDVLTSEERQAIETAFFSELTYQEVATKLNQPLGTVKTRIRSGLGKLRQALAGGKNT